MTWWIVMPLRPSVLAAGLDGLALVSLPLSCLVLLGAVLLLGAFSPAPVSAAISVPGIQVHHL